MSRVLVLFAHPALHRSRANAALADAVRSLPGVTFQDLYAAYPHHLVDVAREQALLRAHDVVVWQHPFHWYSAPSLLKEWQDVVLEHGFAYGDDGTALRGKRVLSAITTGGPAESYRSAGYNRYSMRQLLAPFEQTVNLCGMEYLEPFVVHGVPTLDADALRAVAPHFGKDDARYVSLARQHMKNLEDILRADGKVSEDARRDAWETAGPS